MGKPEALVVGPAMVRPPRPASRDRSVAGTPEPPAAMALDGEVVVIHPSPDELLTDSQEQHEQRVPAGGNSAPWRTGSLPRAYSADAVTVPLAVLSAMPTPRAEPRVLDLPMAALEKPSALLEPTPSPVPRASLIPATRDGAPDAAQVGAVNSRSVPTVAARSLAAERPLRRQPAAAVTFPPGRAQPRERVARRLAADVRSSKREIVLGLTIGMALAAALGVIGQRYLARRAPAGVQAPVVTTAAQLSAVPSAPVREERSLRPRPTTLPAPLPLAEAQESAAETQEPALEVAERPRRARPKASRSKAAARASLPPAAGSPPDLFSEEPRGSSDDAWIEGAKPPAKTPPSPAESAGLGMDLTL
jgi:hypothetical protein